MHQQRRDPLEGVVVDGRYTVHSRLARGGMSTVYLATDRRLDRRVALKVLYPHLAEEPAFVDRFEQEAKSAARLSHPNVVGVLDQGVDDVDGQTVAYLVMEFVQGRTLRDVLRDQGRLTPRDALRYLDDVVKGLAAAHEAGLIHRDVKPENVLLSATGQVKIADFGLARAVSAATGTATLVGTVAYLSPELVLGQPAEAQSDIYSTGIMLYELLTGRQPFTGDMPVQVALQHAQSEVPAPSVLLPGLAADLDELVLWCTARDPEDRPVDGTALLGELQHIRDTLPDADLDYAPEDTRYEVSGQNQLTAAVVPPLPLGGPVAGAAAGAPTEALREFDGRAEDGRARTGSSRIPSDGGPLAGSAGGYAGGYTGTHTAGVGADGDGQDTGDTWLRADASAPGRPRSVDPTEILGRSGRFGGADRGGRADQDDHTGVVDRDQSATRVLRAMPVIPPSSAQNGTVRLGATAATADQGAPRRPVGTDGTQWRSAAPGLPWSPTGPASSSSDGSVEQADDREDRRDTPVPRPRPLSRRQQARQAQRPQKSLQGRGTRRLVRVVVVLLVVLAGLVAGLGWLFGAGPAGVVALPDVANASLADARAALDGEGLASLSTEEVFHDDVVAGLVIGTDPAAFSDVRRYERVQLIVSKGPELFGVPDVVGLTQVGAASELGAAGLAVGDLTEEYSETVPSGEVLRQGAAAGTELRRDSPVDLAVSRGPAPVAVPDVTGRPEAEAVAALESAGLEAEVGDAPQYSRSVPEGTVVAQMPVGVDVVRGTRVTLTLSLGPRIVEVPNVFSLSEERAVSALEDAGFVVEIDYTFGGSVLGLVAGQSRTGDQPEGTTVRITVT